MQVKVKDTIDRNDAIAQLNGRIKVRVTEDRYGGVKVTPTSDNVQFLVACTNEYNYSSDLYIQDSQNVQSFLENFPKARYRIYKNDYDEGYKIGRYTYAVNDNVVMLMDSWAFRHMVGGQSD